MKRDKRGELTYAEIIGFIIAVVVLILVIAYFTGTFKRVQGPVNFTLGEVEKGIQCTQLCSAKSITEFCNLKCTDAGVTCADITC